MVLDHEFPPDIRVEKEITYLQEKGFEIHLACYTRENRIKLEKYNNYIIHRKAITSLVYKLSVICLKVPVYFNFWISFLDDICKKYKFDYIHIHDLPLAKIGIGLSKIYNLKVILDLHENWPQYIEVADHTNTFIGKILSSKKQWIKYEVEMVKSADEVITVAEEMKERLMRFGVKKNENIHVIPNTYDLSKKNHSNDFSPDKNYFTLFYSGGIDSIRGIQYIIYALKEIINDMPNIRFWIIGKGRYEKHLREYVIDNKLEKNIVFWGWQNPSEINKMLSQSDIAVIPHIRSVQTDCSSPNKLFEYMMARKTILSSNCKSVERIINETQCGIVYKHDSIEDIVDKIKMLYNHKEILKQYETNGYNAIINKYNWQNTIKNIDKIYKKSI